jgi:hypothetical protein
MGNSFLKNVKEILREMAIKRSEFIDRVESKGYKIAEHILYLICTSLYDSKNQNINHWKVEIKGWTKELARMMLKDVSTLKQSTYKDVAIKQVITNLGLYDYDTILNI